MKERKPERALEKHRYATDPEFSNEKVRKFNSKVWDNATSS